MSQTSDVMAKHIRNNDRVLYDDPELAKELFQLTSPYLPRYANELIRYKNSRFELCGLNERFRFYRYVANQRFVPHYDGSFIRNESEMSFITLLFYLNNVQEGGETVFCEGTTRNIKAIVKPEQGDALFFAHKNLHGGNPMPEYSQECKYVLRTDVMYRKLG